MVHYRLKLANGLDATLYSLNSNEAKDALELIRGEYKKAKSLNLKFNSSKDYFIIQVTLQGEVVKLVYLGHLKRERPLRLIHYFEHTELKIALGLVAFIIYKSYCHFKSEAIKNIFMMALITKTSPEACALVTEQ